MKSYVRMTKEQEFKIFKDNADGVAAQVIAATLYGLHLQGFRKRRLQKAFENIKSVIEMPEIMGKRLEGEEIIEFIKETYGIDCNEITLIKESEKEYMKRTK